MCWLSPQIRWDYEASLGVATLEALPAQILRKQWMVSVDTDRKETMKAVCKIIDWDSIGHMGVYDVVDKIINETVDDAIQHDAQTGIITDALQPLIREVITITVKEITGKQ